VAVFVFYALFLGALPLLWGVYGESHWLLNLLRYLPGLVLLIPLPVLVLLLRDKKAVLAGAVVGIFGIFYFLGFELPGRSSEGGTLTVMSYNIRAGLGGPESIAKFLADSDTDLVALQEARAPLADSTADPVPAIVERMTGYEMARGGSHLMTGDPTGKLKSGPRSRFLPSPTATNSSVDHFQIASVSRCGLWLYLSSGCASLANRLHMGWFGLDAVLDKGEEFGVVRSSSTCLRTSTDKSLTARPSGPLLKVSHCGSRNI
jgi:hypothetical protein